MMDVDYGMSDEEERAFVGWDADICESCGGFGECADGDCDEFEPDVDDQIKEMKEEGNWPWWK